MIDLSKIEQYRDGGHIHKLRSRNRRQTQW